MKRMHNMADKETQTPIEPTTSSSSETSEDSPRDIEDYPLPPPPPPPFVRSPQQPRRLIRGPQMRALYRFPALHQDQEIPIQARRHPKVPMYDWVEFSRRATVEGPSRFPRFELVNPLPERPERPASRPSASASRASPTASQDEPKEQNETRLHGEGDALLRVDLIPDEDKLVDVENDDDSPLESP